ncbi:MAG TPA: hypothetical protein VIG80_09610 [Bacillaceae bacterium]
MRSAMLVFFLLGAILLSGMLHYLAAHQRPGIYPPKRILKQRARTLGIAGFAFVVLGALLALWIKK